MTYHNTRLVRYHVSRGSGINHREDHHHALIVDEDDKRLKIIIQDLPMSITWVSKKEETFMEPVMVDAELVRHEDGTGKITYTREGGRPYPVGKAIKQFRAQWRSSNEGKVPTELRS